MGLDRTVAHSSNQDVVVGVLSPQKLVVELGLYILNLHSTGRMVDLLVHVPARRSLSLIDHHYILQELVLINVQASIVVAPFLRPFEVLNSLQVLGEVLVVLFVDQVLHLVACNYVLFLVIARIVDDRVPEECSASLAAAEGLRVGGQLPVEYAVELLLPLLLGRFLLITLIQLNFKPLFKLNISLIEWILKYVLIIVPNSLDSLLFLLPRQSKILLQYVLQVLQGEPLVDLSFDHQFVLRVRIGLRAALVLVLGIHVFQLQAHRLLLLLFVV